MFLILMLSVTIAVNAQSVSMDVYHSTGKQTGLHVYKTTKLGFVYGIGGSYYFGTYTGENANKFQEIANAVLPTDGNQWPLYYKQFQYKNFTENRGTVKLLLGYDYGKTSVMINTGLAFRSEYWSAKGGAVPISGYDPVTKYFYTYKNISPQGLIGVTVNQKIAGRFRLSVGWNNIEHLTYGLSYKITPTRLFNW